MDQNKFKYRGARAMTILHAQNMRSCLLIWQKAKASKVELPQTEDSDYDSLDHLLHHVFRAARGYMVWMCEKLQLPDPKIDEAPAVDIIEEKADSYMEYLLAKWELPLVDIEEKRFDEVHLSNWKIGYSIDAMMEHAVMHPIRHEFQLKELMG